MAKRTKPRPVKPANAGQKPGIVSPIWPFTAKASRRIQIGADGAADPEIEGAWTVRVLIRGLQPGPEAPAAALWLMSLIKAHTPAVMWKGAAINGTDTKR